MQEQHLTVLRESLLRSGYTRYDPGAATFIGIPIGALVELIHNESFTKRICRPQADPCPLPYVRLDVLIESGGARLRYMQQITIVRTGKELPYNRTNIISIGPSAPRATARYEASLAGETELRSYFGR